MSSMATARRAWSALSPAGHTRFSNGLRLKVKQDFEAEVWSVLCCISLVSILLLKFGQYFAAEVWS